MDNEKDTTKNILKILEYEQRMLVHSYYLIRMAPPFSLDIKVALESFLIHVRNIYDFLCENSKDRFLTATERSYFERDLNIMLDNFILDISKNRKLSINKIRQLADGSSMLGEQALKNGLIDKIGDIYTVKEFLKEKIGGKLIFVGNKKI
jgi:hypothetical protein